MADGLFYLGYFRGEMWKILKHKKSILHAVLLVIVLLSTARAISPLSSRPASWREALTDIMSISIAEGHRDVWTASVTHIHPSDSRFAAEFPIYNGIVGGVHAILGKAAWHGRMVSLLFAILGLFIFYKIVIISFGDKTIGLLSTVLLALSNWLIIGSQIMPDVPAATMALLAVFFGLKYLKEGKFCVGCCSRLVNAFSRFDEVTLCNSLTVGCSSSDPIKSYKITSLNYCGLFLHDTVYTLLFLVATDLSC